MKTVTDGGPAFPFEFHNQTHSAQNSFFHNRPPLTPGMSEQYGGMSLRDWFAGMALQGMTACPDIHAKNDPEMAKWAYQQADAMLAEREAKK